MGQENNALQVYTGSSDQFIQGILNRAAVQQEKTNSRSSLLNRFWEILHSPQAPYFILAMMAQIVAVGADLIYPQDSSGGEYKIDYDSGDFPSMRNMLQKYCNMVIFTSPQAPSYTGATKPTCRKADVPGPQFKFYSTDGKMPANIATCLKDAMQMMCTDYYNQHPSGSSDSSADGKTILIILLSIAGLVALGCCCYAMVQRCRNRDDYVSPPPYDPLDGAPVRPRPARIYNQAPVVVRQAPIINPAPVVVRPAPVYNPPVIVEPVIVSQPSIFDWGGGWSRPRSPSPPRPAPSHNDVSVDFVSFNDSGPSFDTSSNNDVSVSFDPF